MRLSRFFAVSNCAKSFALFLALAFLPVSSFAQTGYIGIFGGGPYYKNAANNIRELQNSGFTEAIVWSVEVSSVGDLNLNGEFPLTSGGVYVGDQTHPDFAGNMALLKQGNVKRVTLSIGSSNYGDWENIAALVNSQGTGPGSILYQDFLALKTAIPALDAVDFDDENSFNESTTVQFAVMLGNLGYHVVPDAYNNNSYWTSVVSEINSQLPGTTDSVHLQAYAGGGGNNPCTGWDFGSVPVFPGLWDHGDTPKEVQSRMAGWHQQCDILGGFMWLYDDFVGNGEAVKYAQAIEVGVGGSGFALSAPATVFLNQNSSAKATVKITDLGGFKGSISLTVSSLPSGVTASAQANGKNQVVTFKSTSTATTGFFPVTVTGDSAGVTQNFTFTLAVSAATGKGAGQQVNLSPAFNVYGIYNDGTTYSTGGIDGSGNSYSSKLLTKMRVLNGAEFKFGAANQPDAVGCNGQLVSLPQSNYSILTLLAAAVQGSQSSQTFTVNYTDGTSAQFTQSFSDWSAPQNFPGEVEAVAMSYRNTANGTKEDGLFNLYAYQFALNSSKTVASVILPSDPNVVVLAATVQ
jgi:hypothetical protein